MKIFKNLVENEKRIKEVCQSVDVIFYEFKIANIPAKIVFLDDFCDKKSLSEEILKPLKEITGENITISEVEKHALCPEIKEIEDLNEAIDLLSDGETLLFLENEEKCLALSIKQIKTRSIIEPTSSSVISGPREGFIEDIKTNIGLMRRKIKNPHLKFTMLEVGKYTKTKIAVCSITGVTNKKILNDVIRRIKLINIDGILDSSYIAKLIIENRRSLFKQVGSTEKPDILTSKLLAGRIGILVDGSPIAIYVPYLILDDFQDSSDYYSSNYWAIISRFLRALSIIICVFLPALFVSAQLYHLQLIPLNFLLTIVSSIKGIPLSPSLEMFFTLLIFEILNEASVRMPRQVGMALSVVGALVLGETAVRAGIVSSPTIMIVALSGISMFTCPDLADTLSILRLIFLIIAGCFGLYGMALGICFFAIYIVMLQPFDIPITAPFAPLIKKDLKDGFIKVPIFENKLRPVIFGSKNKTKFKDTVIK